MSVVCNLEFTASWPCISFDLEYSWFAVVHLRKGSLPQLSNINSEWKCHPHLSFKLCWIHYTADFIAPSAEREREGMVLNALWSCQEALAAPGAAVPRSRRISTVPAVPCVSAEPGAELGRCPGSPLRVSSRHVLGNTPRPVFPRAPLAVFGAGL